MSTKKTGKALQGVWWHCEHVPEVYPALDVSIAYSGWTDVAVALKHCKNIKPRLRGERYIAFGGNDVCGSFNSCCVDAITRAIEQNVLSGYDGVAYCLMEGVPGLAKKFEASFATAKQSGLKVLVSCIPPFYFGDSQELMAALVCNPNIDILSPQLYETGLEQSADLTLLEQMSEEVSKKQHRFFTQCYARLIPSLADTSHYDAIKPYFQNQGKSLNGFFLGPNPPILIEQ